MGTEQPHERYRREMRERFIEHRGETPWEQYRREMRELYMGLALVFIAIVVFVGLGALLGSLPR